MIEHTPTEAEIVSAYVRDSASIIVKNGTVTNANVEKSHSEATRGIAKIKAGAKEDALKSLLTGEAVERVADALFADLEGCTIAQHEAECPRADCGYRSEYTRTARTAITALLGDRS